MYGSKVGHAAALFALGAWAAGCGYGQVCRLSVAGLNQARRVMGPVNTECPNNPIHSAPFGNWGVTSNYGQKRDGHQFDGWCHESMTCDSQGRCKTDCRDGWYEWNSCTSDPLFKAPNCTLYNDEQCTAQKTTQGINVLGTQMVDVRVGCPVDVNGDGRPDVGGCADVKQYVHTPNFMSLYELDPVTGDDLVQTLYFPATPVPVQCLALSCPAAISEFVPPSFYDSPKDRALVYAEIGTIVNSGLFADPGNICGGTTTRVESASAASYAPLLLAPVSIGSLFGAGLRTSAADTVAVRVIDASGTSRETTSTFASASQVNFVVPAGTAAGQASVAVVTNGQVRATGVAQIAAVAPALFTANATGSGVAAALWQRTGTAAQLAFSCAAGVGSCVAEPIPVGAGDAYLILFGTGVRGRASLQDVQVTVGGITAAVEYAGPQPEFPGLDQINVRLPSQLVGKGVVELRLTITGREANRVTIAAQ